MIGNVNSWGVDVFRVAELVNEGRALTCITYKIFQVILLDDIVDFLEFI